LYQTGKFKQGVPYSRFSSVFSKEEGFTFYWDDKSKAPYAYSPTLKQFATFDDKQSLEVKSNYVVDQRLKGIMFWELSQDIFESGLVDTIYQVKTSK
jgi:chitinase